MRSLIFSIVILTSLVGRADAALFDASQGARWHRLMHYEHRLRGLRSLIASEVFFFAPTGSTDPLAELTASRRAIQTGLPLVGQEAGLAQMDPICAFPARARFMHEVLGDTLRPVVCEGLTYWRTRLPLRSLSLVFASAYANNPASLFGHTFLKLNVDKDKVANPTPDYAVSFSAVPDGSKGFMYMYRGLTGAFFGVYLLNPFYEKLTEYAENENRDLWEYELNLSADQIDRFVEHLWELVNYANSRYYFFDDNCSYAILSLLEAVVPDWDLTSQAGWVVLPHQTVRIVTRDHTKIRAAIGHPSLRSRFETTLAQLDLSDETRLRRVLVADADVSDVHSAPVLEAAIKYYNLRKTEKSGKLRGTEQNHYQRILERRADLGIVRQAPLPTFDLGRTTRPDIGHGPVKVSLGLINDGAPHPGFGARYGFHDLLDDDRGFEPNLQINYLDLQGSANASHPVLDRFRAVDIVSLRPWSALDSGFSWKVAIGHTNRPEPAHSYIEAGGGLDLGLFGNRVQVFTLPSACVRQPKEGERTALDLSSDVGMLWRIGPGDKVFVRTARTWASDHSWQGRWHQEARLAHSWADQQIQVSANWDRRWWFHLSWGVFLAGS